MAQKLEATTADVIVCFQKRPGTDSDSIVNAGDAKIRGTNVTIKPQGKGYYGLKMGVGSTCELEVSGLSTTYKIVHEPQDKLERGTKDDFTITSWKVLGDISVQSNIGDNGKLSGIQRHLQLLGYYTGKVDNIVGEKTERAILNFQADNQLRMDGIVGIQTGPKLNNIVKNENKSGDTYIARRTLIRFTRAVTGPPNRYAPDLDDRGQRWTQIGVTVGDLNEVKLIRENIAESARLFVTSEKAGVVSIDMVRVNPDKNEIIIGLRGVSPGNAKIQVRLDEASGVIISELNVYVMEMLPSVKVCVHRVTIFDGTGASGTTTRSWGGIDALFRQANDIWRPCGINFSVVARRETPALGTLPLVFTTAGTITTNISAGIWGEFTTVLRTNRMPGVVNVYFVRSANEATGLTYDNDVPPDYGVVVSDQGNARTLAHELGHFLNLDKHSNPDNKQERHNIWYIRRLMYGIRDAPSSPDWRNDVGYGRDRPGAMITIKNFPVAQDPTDGECATSRKRAKNPY